MDRRRTPSVDEMHRAWLELVDTDGPFLATPALKTVWPQGIPEISDRSKGALAGAKPEFDAAWDRWDRERSGDAEAAAAAYAPARDVWVDVALREVLGWGDRLQPAEAIPAVVDGARATSPDGRVSVQLTAALVRDDLVGALVWVIDPVDDLRDLIDDGWAASPIDRMEAMLRASDATTIGVVTDGRWWALVSAAAETMTASGIVDAQTWVEEPAVRDAFVALLSRKRLVGGAEKDRLPTLFAESVLAAEQITEALGVQVRRAVELVVSAFGEAEQQARERGEPSVLPDDESEIYDAVVTTLMRVVFLLFAEERGLLPQGQLFEAGYGLGTVLDGLDERARHEGEESMEHTHLAWHRLLATSQALYEGASFEDMRLPSYGGSLFDPERFPFLTATTDRGTLALTVNDRVMLHVLRAVQIAKPKGQDARRVSFRDIDVEQIGYIYEGLLGYTCKVATEVVVGLPGAAGQEPEIPLDLLDDLAEDHQRDPAIAKAILAWVKSEQPGAKPSSVTALTKALGAGDTMDDAERALLSVARDADLRDRLRPWIGAIRRDLRNRPLVVQPGGLLVVETPSRRNSGAHYTPRSLAEEVVEHALEPLVYAPGPHQTANREQWQPISSDDLLDLKVADIACGSGAFLVAAARYLARKLVEAWHREGLSYGTPQETEIRALRKVVAQCLYGADINPMAIEMCKLSLWLVSLDRDLSFSFVDDKVLVGNSLLGVTDLKQIEAMHIDPSAVPAAEGLFALSSDRQIGERLELDQVIARVRRRRQQLASEVDDRDPQRTATAKRNLMATNERDLAQLTAVADGVIAAGLRHGGKPGKKLNEAYENLRVAAGQAYPSDGAGYSAMLDGILAAGLTPTVETDYDRWQPLHWALAVPDVMERGGFDAIIGNPPFLGGPKLTGAMGGNVRDWFVNVLAEGARGSADLVGYFLLRAFSLLTSRGTLGLIATNTVAQGDTREVALDRMVADSFTITRAIQSRSWPAEGASLEYAAVWGARGDVAEDAPRIVNDLAVHRISTLLEPAGRVDGLPVRLTGNASTAFGGCKPYGDGYMISAEEGQAWVAEDSRVAEVIAPYLNGEDLNSDPHSSPSRWTIDFFDRSEEVAKSYAAPYERLRMTVKDERQNSNRKALRERWWQFADKRPALRVAIQPLSEVLVIAVVSRSVMPLRVPTGQVFSHALSVFATDSFADQAVLSSSLHQMWAIKYGSGMRSDPRYTPSDVFETFPRPEPTDDLESVGKTLDTERREIMLRRDLGLTKLYNMVNDPDITDSADPDVARMRAIHVALDECVMAAYGWDDVPLDHGFHTYRQMRRWTVSPAARVEILDRLLEENHRRAAAEANTLDRVGERPSASRIETTEDDDEGTTDE